MYEVRARWIDGQIKLEHPVEWPEGCDLLVRPIAKKIGLTEDEWSYDPEAIAEWEAQVRAIQPLEMTDEERADFEKYRAEVKRYTIEAVRRKMETTGQDD